MEVAREMRKILEVIETDLSLHSKNDNKNGILECLGRLRKLLGKDVDEALGLIDDDSIRIIQDTRSGRKIVFISARVPLGTYYLYPSINYCACPDYKQFVIEKKVKFMVSFIQKLFDSY
uniref:DUF4258 domain-containing protein n=1 Tax=Parastrongyloides trichosuri TaxID=131310 RepID=A0A0N5A5K4_PARTI